MHRPMNVRLHTLFNTSEMGWTGIPLKRAEEGTEDLRETFVLPQYTQNEHRV